MASTPARNTTETQTNKSNRCQLAKLASSATTMAGRAMKMAKEKVNNAWQTTAKYVTEKAQATKVWAEDITATYLQEHKTHNESDERTHVKKPEKATQPTQDRANKATPRTKWHALLSGSTTPEGKPKLTRNNDRSGKMVPEQVVASTSKATPIDLMTLGKRNPRQHRDDETILKPAGTKITTTTNTASNTTTREANNTGNGGNTDETSDSPQARADAKSKTKDDDRQHVTANKTGGKASKPETTKIAISTDNNAAKNTENTGNGAGHSGTTSSAKTRAPLANGTAHIQKIKISWPTKQNMVKIYKSKVLHYEPGKKRAKRNKIPTICHPTKPVDKFVWARRQRRKKEKLAQKWTTKNSAEAIKAAWDRAKKKR
jgi:hypothetical protein